LCAFDLLSVNLNSAHLPVPKFSFFFAISACGSSGGSFISLCMVTHLKKARTQGDEPQPLIPPAERLSASLLPSEIVRIEPVQVIKLDRVVVTRRMQHETMLHDPSAPWSSVDRGHPGVHSCAPCGGACGRCPSALSGDPRVAWLASRTGAHRGLAIIPPAERSCGKH
jgi:hypothetical protein